MATQVVHRLGKGVGVRYGDENGEFDEGCVARIAQFVLGLDVDTRVTALNERLTAVISPVKDFWSPSEGVADLEVVDPKTNSRIALSLGQWLVRYSDGYLRPLSHNKFVAEGFPAPKEKTFYEELVELMDKHDVSGSSAIPSYILAAHAEKCTTLLKTTTISIQNYSARKAMVL